MSKAMAVLPAWDTTREVMPSPAKNSMNSNDCQGVQLSTQCFHVGLRIPDLEHKRFEPFFGSWCPGNTIKKGHEDTIYVGAKTCSEAHTAPPLAFAHSETTGARGPP